MAKGRKAGRPTKAAAPGKRVSLGLKVSPRLKTLLDSAAKENVRTQSQEAEARLALTFEDMTLLPQLLESAFGANTAGLLLAMGWAMSNAGRYATAYMSDGQVAAGIGPWAKNAHAYDQATRAATVILERARPEGNANPSGAWLEIGEAVGELIWDEIKRTQSSPPYDIVQRLLAKETSL
jgi:hypothetical protein